MFWWWLRLIDFLEETLPMWGSVGFDGDVLYIEFGSFD